MACKTKMEPKGSKKAEFRKHIVDLFVKAKAKKGK